ETEMPAGTQPSAGARGAHPRGDAREHRGAERGDDDDGGYGQEETRAAHAVILVDIRRGRRRALVRRRQASRRQKKGARRPPEKRQWCGYRPLERPASGHADPARLLVARDGQEVRVGDAGRRLDVVVEGRGFLRVEDVEDVETEVESRVPDLELVAAV